MLHPHPQLPAVQYYLNTSPSPIAGDTAGREQEQVPAPTGNNGQQPNAVPNSNTMQTV